MSIATKIIEERRRHHEEHPDSQKVACVKELANIKPGVLEAYRHEVIFRELGKILRLIDREELAERSAARLPSSFKWKGGAA